MHELSAAEAEVLIDAMQVLEKFDDWVDAETPTDGVIHAKADTAGDAVFDFLNHASSYGHVEVATNALKKYQNRVV